MPLSTAVFPTIVSFLTNAFVVFGNVAIGASGAVGAKSGRGFTVTKAGTGLYNVVVDGQGALNVYFAIAQCNRSTSTGFAVRVLSITASTRTIALQTGTNAAPDTAADLPNPSVLEILAFGNNAATGF